MTDMAKRRFLELMAAGGLAGALPSASAQDAAANYPTKPIRFIVAFPPGGGTDALARLVGQALGESLGQPIVVDNRPGASGIVAAQAVIAAPHDGYTLLVGGSGVMVFAPVTYGKKLPYDSEKDIAAVTVLGSYANVIAVNKDSPVKDLKDLVALAKRGKVSYGHPGVTFQVPMEAFLQDAGAQMLSVPYKGGGPLATALMGGEIDAAISDISTFAQLHKSGKLRVLAVTTFNRASLLPEVPTLREFGYLKDFEASTFAAVGAPGGTPPAIIRKLQVEIAKVLRNPAITKRLEEMSIEPGGRSPEETRARYRTEIAKYRPLAEKAGLLEK